MKTLIQSLLVISTLLIGSAHAYESDQHSVPDFEFADVGSDVSIFIYNQTKKAIDQVNIDLKQLPTKIEQVKNRINTDEAREKPFLMSDLKGKLKLYTERLESIQTKEGIVLAVYDELGGTFTWQDQVDGVFRKPLTIIPYPTNYKDGLRITYQPDRNKNIYALAGFHRIIPSSYFVFCSSLKMFGVYFGVDKLGHMFNQGYEYFTLFTKEKKSGKNYSDALKSVVEWGRKTEDGMYGTIVDGVYSNGDLAANFSGFHFYQNLLEPITIDQTEHLPLLKINEDKSVSFNSDAAVDGASLLKPFFSNHLNEALNPSHYEKLQRVMVKRAVKARCEDVLRFYNITNREEIKDLTNSLSLWHGLDYGHRDDDVQRIDELCF